MRAAVLVSILCQTSATDLKLKVKKCFLCGIAKWRILHPVLYCMSDSYHDVWWHLVAPPPTHTTYTLLKWSCKWERGTRNTLSAEERKLRREGRGITTVICAGGNLEEGEKESEVEEVREIATGVQRSSRDESAAFPKSWWQCPAAYTGTKAEALSPEQGGERLMAERREGCA